MTAFNGAPRWKKGLGYPRKHLSKRACICAFHLFTHGYIVGDESISQYLASWWHTMILSLLAFRALNAHTPASDPRPHTHTPRPHRTPTPRPSDPLISRKPQQLTLPTAGSTHQPFLHKSYPGIQALTMSNNLHTHSHTQKM